jgi:hypothetical protein
VVVAGVPHPIPFRTRSLSPPALMVLCLKARESKSLPGLPSQMHVSLRKKRGLLQDLHPPRMRNAARPVGVDLVHTGRIGPRSRFWAWPSGWSSEMRGGVRYRTGAEFGDAGWSSPVARQAHNLKVPGSNPGPAPKRRTALRAIAGPFAFWLRAIARWRTGARRPISLP